MGMKIGGKTGITGKMEKAGKSRSISGMPGTAANVPGRDKGCGRARERLHSVSAGLLIFSAATALFQPAGSFPSGIRRASGLSTAYAIESALDISVNGPVQDMANDAAGQAESSSAVESSAATGNEDQGVNASEPGSTLAASEAGTEGAGTAALDAGAPAGTSDVNTAEGSSASTGNAESLASSTGTASANLAALSRDEATKDIGDLANSEYAVIYDLDENRIVAEKNADAVIYPASMTKIMTILLCAEHVTDLDEKLTITQDILDYIYAQDASNCGYAAGEQIAVRDLLYGIVLPSGADAVMAVTRRVAGSDSAFVEMMNQKAQALGLSSNAHFANATGLYAADHHLTAKDMAQILNAAMQNPLARQVLSTPTYQTAPTNVRSKGIQFSNLFLQRIATQDTGGTSVQAAKTGYISQSRNCAASYGTSQSGKHYIVVTGRAANAWQCVYDHAAIYRTYTSGS